MHGEPSPLSLTRRGFLGAAAAVPVASRSSKRARSRAVPVVPTFAAASIRRDGLAVSVGTNAPAHVRIRAWCPDNPGALVESPWVATNAARVVKMTVPQAGTPRAGWLWQGLVRDAAGTAGVVADVVRRMPSRPAPGDPSAFTFCFGSCVLVGSRLPTLRVALERSPQFFALIGDMGYVDAQPWLRQDYPLFVEQFTGFLRHRDVAPLLAATPLVAVQDDHDYGLDECDARTYKPYAAKAFADVVPGTSAYPTGESYRRWSIGEVDFFLLDNRRYREPDSGPWENRQYPSRLGSTQRSWLLSGLKASRARVKIVFSPAPLSWYYLPAERQEILDFVEANVAGPVIFCEGDKHAGAFVRPSEKVWELLAAPLQNPSKADLRSVPGLLWTENGAGPAASNVVGVVEVDTLVTQTVRLRLLREDGVQLHARTVPVPRRGGSR